MSTVNIETIEEDFYLNSHRVYYTEIVKYRGFLDHIFCIKICIPISNNNIRIFEEDEIEMKTEAAIFAWNNTSWVCLYNIFYKNTYTYTQSKRFLKFDKNWISEDRLRLLRVAIKMYGEEIDISKDPFSS